MGAVSTGDAFRLVGHGEPVRRRPRWRHRPKAPGLKHGRHRMGSENDHERCAAAHLQGRDPQTSLATNGG
jgi:hypothetical protein